MKDYRERLKSQPELYETTKKYHAAHMKLQRSLWTEEQKQLNREHSRKRMKLYRERKKLQKASTENKELRTRQDIEKQRLQREKWKLAKRQQRQNLSSQKKRRIKEKDRDRKRKKKENQLPVHTILPLQSRTEDVTSQSISASAACSTSSTTSAYNTNSALNKAVTRAKAKLPKSPTKYAEVVAKLIEKASPIKSDALKRKGIESAQKHRWIDYLSDTIKKTYESMQGRRKNQVYIRREFVRQLAVKVKHRNKSKVCHRLGINRKFFSKATKDLKSKKRKDALGEDVLKSVDDFYKREDISINVPNKKFINRKNESKYILQTSYVDCYEKWKENKPAGKQLSFSKFVKLKPKNVLTQKKRHLLNCLCEYCEGARLKINAINTLAMKLKKPDLKLGDKNTCVNLILCPKDENEQEYRLECIDRVCQKCSTENIETKLQPLHEIEKVTWQSWDLVKYTNTKTGKVSSKRELVEKSDSPAAFIELFLKDLTFLAVHLFEARWQQIQFSHLSKSLKHKQIMITADFAENFTCFSQNEIQGAHWMRNCVTIHPTIVNYTCPMDGKIVEESIDIISDDLVHDVHAFNKFLKEIHHHLTDVQKIDFEEIVIASDGCAAQYKSKAAFLDVSTSVEDLGVIIERAYYGSRHGKNRCDGEGGILKSKVTRAIRNGEAVINTAAKFAEYCKSTLSKGNTIDEQCNHKRRTIIYISKDDIDHKRPLIDIKPLKGTRKLHSVRTVRSGVLMTRRLSCFCNKCQHFQYDQCLNSFYVDKWNEVSLLHVPRVGGLCKQRRQGKKQKDQHLVVHEQQQLEAHDEQQQPEVHDEQQQPEVHDEQQQPEVQEDMTEKLPPIEIDEHFEGMTEVNMSFDDISFNTSLDIDTLLPVLDDSADTMDTEQKIEEKEKYDIGEYMLVKNGSNLLPAVVTGTEASLFWVNFFSKTKFSDQWTEDNTPFTVAASDILRKLEPPDLVFVRGSRSRYNYKFVI